MLTIESQLSSDPGLDIPAIEIPTDATLAEIARRQVEQVDSCSEIPYFLRENDEEHDALLAALRAVWLDGCLAAAAALAGGEADHG